jgi:hypothetical protein
VTVTDDWPDPVPIIDAELDVFEAWFGDLFDEPFGVKSGDILPIPRPMLSIGGPRPIVMSTTFSLWPSDGGGGAGETGSAQGIVNEGGDFNVSD